MNLRAIDRELSWLVPYLERAALHPALQRPVPLELYVRAWRPQATAGDWNTPYGACWGAEDRDDLDEGVFEIQVAVESPLTVLSTVTSRPVPREELLDTLAHELAHLVVRDHSEAHEQLTQDLLAGFGSVAPPSTA